MKTKSNSELCQLATEIGNFIQYWGFKKIHGQIWALVFLSKKPLNSTYLTKKLGVSKALISLAIKDLLHYKVIQIVEKKSKEIYFESNPDIFQVVTHVLKTREEVMLHTIAKCHLQLTESKTPLNFDYELNSSRLEELGFMILAAQSMLKSIVDNGLNEGSLLAK